MKLGTRKQPRPVQQLKPRYCERCGSEIVRKRILAYFEPPATYNKRRFCDAKCAGIARRTKVRA